MRTHLAVMFFRYALKSHIKGVMSRSSQGFDTGINLLQLTAERLFSIIDAAVYLVIRKLISRLILDSALSICREELIVESILIGSLPDLLTIFIGELSDFSGKLIGVTDG